MPARASLTSERSRRRSSRSRTPRADAAGTAARSKSMKWTCDVARSLASRGCCWRSGRGGARRGRAGRGPRGRPRARARARASRRPGRRRSSSANVAAPVTSRVTMAPRYQPHGKRSTRAASTSGAATPRRMRLLGERELADRARRPPEVAIVDEVADRAAAAIPAQHAALVGSPSATAQTAPRPPASGMPATTSGVASSSASRSVGGVPSRSVSEPHRRAPDVEARRHAALPLGAPGRDAVALPGLGGAQHLAVGLDDREDEARDAVAAATPQPTRPGARADGRRSRRGRPGRRRRRARRERLEAVDRRGHARRDRRRPCPASRAGDGRGGAVAAPGERHVHRRRDRRAEEADARAPRV